MKKSGHLDLLSIDLEEDGYYSDSEDFMNMDANDSIVYTAPIEHFSQMFKVQQFRSTRNLHFAIFDENDFALEELNRPLFENQPKTISEVAVIYVMLSQPSYFPAPVSDYFDGKPVFYMWRDMKNMIQYDFATYAQNYLHSKYFAMKHHVRFFFHVVPSVEKLNTVASIRNDIKKQRILFHYIGYGFQTIGSNIYALDPKMNRFQEYPLSNLIDSIKTPALFVFDCSNAGTALKTIKRAQAGKEDEDADDWICFCATGVNEELPTDPHLPRDFLTSCLLTPTRMAILCHILQYYRTTMVTNDFPMDSMDSYLLKSNEEDGQLTPLHKELQLILDAITDAIAADSLPPEMYKKYFQADDLTTKLFHNFLLAQFLLRKYQINPAVNPDIPNLATHPLWQQWRTIVDMAVFCQPEDLPDIFTDFYKRSLDTFKGFLARQTYDIIPLHIMSILFHIPNNKELVAEACKLISKYAGVSDKTKETLANIGHIDVLFNIALSKMFDDDFLALHSVLYIIVVMLQKMTDLPNSIRMMHPELLIEYLFNEKLNQDTRTLAATIIAILIPCNENIKQFVVTEQFFLNMRSLLENSNAELTLWALIIERKVLEVIQMGLQSFYQNGLHIQAASFCLHHSQEVRAAALATITYLLRKNQDTSNMHLFGLALLAGFDGSFIVRYNFIHFLTTFLSIYESQLSGKISSGFLSHQPYITLLSQWGGNETADLMSISELFDFESMASYVTKMMHTPDPIQKFIGIGIFFAEFLSDDPHPSVRNIAAVLQQNNQDLSGVKRKLSTMSNKLSAPIMNGELQHFGNSVPSQMPGSEYDSSFDDGSLAEAVTCGGNALDRVCLSQIVRSGLWKPYYAPRSSYNLSALPSAPVSSLPSIQVMCNYTYNLNNKPTDLAYDKDSRDVAISFDNGAVSYIRENGTISTIMFTSRVTSLQVTQYHNKPFTLIGTEDGCCHVWDCQSKFPSETFRSDGVPYCHSSQFVCPVNNEEYILTARGNCGSVRLWDVTSQRLVHEWLPTKNNKDNMISGLTVDPVTGSCVVGFSTGLLVSIETKAKELQRTGNPNVAVIDKIMDIKATMSPTKTFFAATMKGQLLKWTDFSVISPFINLERETIVSFDVHSLSPILSVSTKSSAPILISCDAKVLARLNEAGPGAIIRFHPSLPLIGAVSESGTIYEYDIIDAGGFI